AARAAGAGRPGRLQAAPGERGGRRGRVPGHIPGSGAKGTPSAAAGGGSGVAVRGRVQRGAEGPCGRGPPTGQGTGDSASSGGPGVGRPGFAPDNRFRGGPAAGEVPPPGGPVGARGPPDRG